VSGIGEKLAENIVNYRSENGPFEDRENLSKAFAWKTPLDNVHPAYSIVKNKDLKLKTDLIPNKRKQFNQTRKLCYKV
jgi:uncharacterized protein